MQAKKILKELIKYDTVKDKENLEIMNYIQEILEEKGNMRDYTDLLHLVILNNLQNTNAELIEEKIPQNQRLIRLNKMAKRQMEILKDNRNIKELETLQKQVNDNKLLISDGE